MTFLAIILAIVALWLIFSPVIKPWLQRRAREKMADFMRAQMGMPTGKEQRKAERRQRNDRRKSFWSRPASSASESKGRAPEEIIPREYAVDVEYTEIKTFSQTVIAEEDPTSQSGAGKGSQKIVVESQVSDVEYTEIKISDAK